MYSNSQDTIDGLETGGDDYTMKPFGAEELVVKIENLIKESRKLHEHFNKEGRIELEDKEVTSIDKKLLQNVNQLINKHL